MVPAQLDVLLWHIRKLAAGPYLSQQTDQQLLDDFAVHRDDSAFAALVSRHGSMVLRVCRRVLCHEQDAEDAFQATFLVLARNSASIRKRAALAPWLHGVAYRIAMKAKRSAARRRTHETRRGVLTPRLVPNPTWDDVQVVLDEEIERLPERFRTAFVLCILEGKSRPEAAAELGIKEGTVSSRLSRARQRLQQQLGRRGIELSALLAALSVAENASRAVPAALVRTTLRWGLLVAAGGTAVEMIPTHVAILATGVTKAMFLTKAKIATAMLLTLTLMAGGVGVLTHQVRAGKPVAPQEIKSPGNAAPQLATQRESATPRATAASKEEAEDSIRFSGRVVDPQGRPVEDAKLYLAEASPNKRSIALRTTSDADGRYRFLIRKSEFEKSYSQEPWKFALVVALAENFGLGISRVSVDKPPVREDAIIQLVKDDVPITGRLIDLQGKPIAGVQIHVRGIQFPRDRDLTTFIDALKTKKEGERPQQ
ncbi:MAG TPA: sigma-70 family RNA polymerase sigma factor, partial [Gemmataceae bacterium]|nr:sigma-70 family RNA polymerase sigma factor [Gemmataceae bacterium]